MRFVGRIFALTAALCLSTAIAQAQTITLNGAVQLDRQSAV